MKRLFLLALAALFAAVLLHPATSALAGGRGGNGGNGATITLDQADPHFGDLVTFTVSTDMDNDWVNARCYQSGALVYSQWREAQDYSAGPFTLGPTPSWSGGAADCVAEIVRIANKNRVLGTTRFSVAP